MKIGRRILEALRRARRPILAIAATYVLSVTVGAALVHSGNLWSLRYRDRLVAAAGRSDPSALALAKGLRVRAAMLDLGRNLFLGAIPDTVGGLGVVFPFALAAYRGWIGGIVSVDHGHASRLKDSGERRYYLLTLLLQLLPYSLAGGAGVRLGLELFTRARKSEARWWPGIPRAALFDVFWIYTLVVPLFLTASLWEFLAR